MRITTAVAALAALCSTAEAAEITPDSVRAALPKLDAIVAEVLDKTAVPGLAVGVVVGDEVVYAKGFGV
ncbi:MAG: serine hydrolase, partial [Rhizobiales bacterium]|nr:serine hydrolase [Hyphomicrobiales bacterium]